MAQRTKLKTIRKSRGLTQEQLSEATQIPKRTIQHFEQRTRDIDGAHLETLADLCIVLDCGIEDILESKELIAKLQKMKGEAIICSMLKNTAKPRTEIDRFNGMATTENIAKSGRERTTAKTEND